MQIEPYYSIQGDGKLITLNGTFTPSELRDILDEAGQYPRWTMGETRTWHGPAANLQNLPREAEIDDDDLLA